MQRTSWPPESVAWGKVAFSKGLGSITTLLPPPQSSSVSAGVMGAADNRTKHALAPQGTRGGGRRLHHLVGLHRLGAIRPTTVWTPLIHLLLMIYNGAQHRVGAVAVGAVCLQRAFCLSLALMKGAAFSSLVGGGFPSPPGHGRVAVTRGWRMQVLERGGKERDAVEAEAGPCLWAGCASALALAKGTLLLRQQQQRGIPRPRPSRVGPAPIPPYPGPESRALSARRWQRETIAEGGRIGLGRRKGNAPSTGAIWPFKRMRGQSLPNQERRRAAACRQPITGQPGQRHGSCVRGEPGQPRGGAGRPLRLMSRRQGNSWRASTSCQVVMGLFSASSSMSMLVPSGGAHARLARQASPRKVSTAGEPTPFSSKQPEALDAIE
jgi:hypothetical protein